MLHLCLVALVAVIAANIVAVVAFAVSMRRDLTRVLEP